MPLRRMQEERPQHPLEFSVAGQGSPKGVDGGTSLEEDDVLDEDVNHENGDDVPGTWGEGRGVVSPAAPSHPLTPDPTSHSGSLRPWPLAHPGHGCPYR